MKFFNKSNETDAPKIKKVPRVYTAKQIRNKIILILVVAAISSVSTLYINGFVSSYIKNEVKAQVTSLTQK